MDSPEEEFQDGEPRFFRHARAACRLLLCVAFVGLLASILIPAAAQAQSKRVLLYTGTTGFRHTDGINGGRPVVQTALQTAGYTVDWEDCTNNGGGSDQLRQRQQEPAHLHGREPRAYDAIVLLNSSVGPSRSAVG